MLRLNLIIQKDESKIQAKSGITVFSGSRVMLLNQYVEHSVEFIYNGIIMSHYKPFEHYNIVSDAIIVAIPKQKKNQDLSINAQFPVLLSPEQISILTKAQQAENYYRLKQKTNALELMNKLKLKDMQILQKMRRNSKIMKRLSLFMRNEEKTDISEAFETTQVKDIIYPQPLEPSTDPLPILW